MLGYSFCYISTSKNIRPRYEHVEMYIGNSKYTTFTKLVQVRNFITFDLKVIRHEARETQSFYADCFYICHKPRVAPVANYWSSPESQPSFSEAGTQLTNFSQIPKSSAHDSGDVIHIPWSQFYLGFLFWHLWMRHPLRTRVDICVNVAPN